MALSTHALERLSTELLLSKGGGIYYDAARVAADDTTATLFVGLGGTGADMLIRIKNEVKRRMVLPQDNNGKIMGDTPGNIGFLAFDTDKTTNDKTWGIASFDKYGKEFCSLAVDSIHKVVEDRCRKVDQGDPLWQWYEKIPADAAIRGANGKRQVGRLLLFENANRVYDAIQSRVDEIRRVGDGIKTVNIMLVTGIAGGTGSGTFIDMAYLIKKALDDLDVKNKQLFGFIILPDVNLLLMGQGTQRDRLAANGFAALKELDYWMCSEDGQQSAVYERNYGQGIDVKMQRRIFDFCHLLSAQDFGGNPLTYDKVISSMAEFVFAYTAGEVAQGSGNSAMESMYDNIGTYIEDLAGSVPTPACYSYLAVGTHKLEIPFEEISTLLAIRLFERLEPVFALRPTEETFMADMKILRLIPRNVIHSSLTENMSPSPIDGNPNYQYSQIWGGTNDSYNRNDVYADVYRWYAQEYQTTVTRNTANYANVQNGYFLDFVKDSMKKTNRGPVYLAYLLKSDSKWSIIPTLSEIAQHCSDVAATCENRMSAMEEELRREYNSGHGKILNRRKAVEDYISALRQWIENIAGAYVYAERANVVRQLRDRLLVYYENIFSKLADVIEALPGIFRQNMDHINIKHREAIDAKQLDDTKLIWPLAFEEENRVEFEKILKGACANFLENLTANSSRWTGCDLDAIDKKTDGSTDVPGFISGFISEQFGSLLNINMEDIIRSKLGGAEDIDDYLHTSLLRLKERSVPMFNVDGAHRRDLGLNEFALVSVPDDCENIKAAARKYLPDRGVSRKESREKTRLYYVKVISGIPLFGYSNIKEFAKSYKGLIGIKGMHLDPTWGDYFPTPYPEAVWPMDYFDEDIKNYNQRIRTAFDKCLASGIITLTEGTVTKGYILKLADEKKARLMDTELHGTIEERLSQLDEIQNEIWGSNSVAIPFMGNLQNSTLEQLTRESVLRLPRICKQIGDQLKWLDICTSKRLDVEDPRYFAYALLCGLVIKKGFEVVLKRSLDSIIVDTLFDTTEERTYAEYETFRRFREFLDDKRREDINMFRKELLRRIAQGSAEKTEAIERIDGIISAYSAVIPAAQERVSRAASDKRRDLQDILDFYTTILSIAEKYKTDYLS